jgi:hypothetical protein
MRKHLLALILVAITGCTLLPQDMMGPVSGQTPGSFLSIPVPSEQPGVVTTLTPQIIQATVIVVVTAVPQNTKSIVGSWYCRVQPNVSSEILIYLHDGEVVEIIDPQGSWTLIHAGSKTCYVKSDAFAIRR